jgi:hypothetical protein
MDVFEQVLEAIISTVRGTREQTQDDYALCGPGK